MAERGREAADPDRVLRAGPAGHGLRELPLFWSAACQVTAPRPSTASAWPRGRDGGRASCRSRWRPASPGPTCPCGRSVIVVAPTATRPWPGDGGRDRRLGLAAARAWHRRPLAEAVAPRWRERAATRSSWPTWRTTPAAAPGDSTEILRELLRVGARAAPRWRACGTQAAVQACVTAGVGAPRHARRRRQGRSTSHGAPLTRDRTRAHAVRRALRAHGPDVARAARAGSAPPRCSTSTTSRSSSISNRRQTLDPEMIRFVGIDPAAEKILVVKSSIHYRAAFEPLATRDPRGRRARAVVVEPRALRVHARATPHLPARRPVCDAGRRRRTPMAVSRVQRRRTSRSST